MALDFGDSKVRTLLRRYDLYVEFYTGPFNKKYIKELDTELAALGEE
jgi:hypothetical protein